MQKKINQKPVVSYILCIHNGEKTLRESLDSLLRQEGVEVEVIAIDDGSKDESLEILKTYRKKDARLRVFAQPNLGLANARNRGITLAKGKYIASGSQDDIYLPQKTIEQIRFMEKRNLDFAFTSIQTIDEKGNNIKFRSMRDFNMKIFPLLAVLQVATYLQVCSPTFLCKSKCYDKLRWNSGILIGSDLNLWLKMFLHFRGGKLKDKLVLKRIRLYEHEPGYRGRYSEGFKKFERRIAVEAAFLSRFGVHKLSPWIPYGQLLSVILDLEGKTPSSTAYSALSTIYRRMGSKDAANTFRLYAENLRDFRVVNKAFFSEGPAARHPSVASG